MIQLNNIALAFGGQQVLDGVTWTIKANERIGLIGPNGAGKTTLLRVISGQHKPDAGEVSMGRGETLGYLEQDVQEASPHRSILDEAMQAFEDVLLLEEEERRLTKELDEEDAHASEHYHDLLHRLERVQATLVAREAHRAKPQAEAVLTGLGFDADDLGRPISGFSGGWRMRVALARLLLRRPDVLLLDEPTNHLDIDSIDWLETYLKGYPGTVVIVSHDRYFLDRMVTTIAELAGGHLTEYAGNYTYYLEARVERRQLQQAAYENQQKMIAETERFIERFRAKATKARQVQSRVKSLEKLERIAPPPAEEAGIQFRFPEPARSGRTVMELSTFSKTYDGDEGRVEVFQKAGPLQIERGDKIALIGPNGAGKSTLARMLRGSEPFDGTREVGYRVEMTYFAQHQADTLEPDLTIFDILRRQARGQSDTEIRSILGAFLFTGDDVFKKVHMLSGGEKSRVALAATLLAPANLLLLDEPTNHLDIRSIRVLVEALRQFAGTFVVVSHDRHFLDQITSKIWRVGGGTVQTFLGSYSDYRWQVEHGSARLVEVPQATNGQPSKPAPQKTESSGPKTKEQKRREAEERNRRYQEQKAGRRKDVRPDRLSPQALQAHYEHVEQTILEKETRQAELEAKLADPALYEDVNRTQKTTAAYQAVERELKQLYKEWEAAAEHLAAQQAA